MKKARMKMMLSLVVACSLSFSTIVYDAKAATISEQEYYNLLSKFTYSQPYDALKVLKNANADYPTNQRFIDEIKSRVSTILTWSDGSHRNNNFAGAVYGYDTVINAPVIPQYIKDYSTRQKTQANLSKLPLSADEYNSLALNCTRYQPYDALNIYSEALVEYPNDKRLIDGINDRAGTILEWSKGSHSLGNYDAAIYGYTVIINAPCVSQQIKDSAQFYLSYAKNNKKFYTANEYYNLSLQYGYSQPYQALNVLLEANTNYPNDDRFIKAINDRVATILIWSNGSHINKNYSGAISGYNTIINTPAAKYYRDYAKRQKDRAVNSQQPMSASDYSTLIKNYSLSAPYDMFAVCNEASVMFSGDKDINTALNNAANVILSWSIGTHKNGNFESGLYGYNTLKDSPYISEYTRNAAISQGNQASCNKYPITADEYYNKGMQYGPSQPYNVLSTFSEGLTMYSDSRLQSYLNSSAATILEWSKGTHMNGNYEDAKYGYAKVCNNPFVSSELKNTASALYFIANKNLPYSNDGKYIINTKYDITMDSMINMQMAKGGPLTDLYGGGWQPAKVEDVSYYVNPNNFFDNNGIYQFLILSGQAGVSVDDLNNLLSGKGKLANMGSSFIEASLRNNVNEIYLVSHSLLETGNGTSQLASGVTYNSKTVYNMFGVGAYDKPFYPSDGSNPNPTAWGAKFAYDNGWFTPEAAIIGGAKFIGNGYVNNGQDTLYKMRWNVNNTYHQYATDIGWAYKQVNRIKSLYDKCSKYILRFDIPQYKDMN